MVHSVVIGGLSYETHVDRGNDVASRRGREPHVHSSIPSSSSMLVLHHCAAVLNFRSYLGTSC